jgi:DNA-binding NarL/FixJ family response regulator
MTRVQIISSTSDAARVLRSRLADDTIEVVAQGSWGAGGDSVRIGVDVVVADDAAGALGMAWRDGTRLLVLSNDLAVADRLRATAPGAWGVASPDVDAEALRAAVRAVAAGFSVAMQRPSVPMVRPSAPVEDVMPTESLTPREQDVLQLLAEGLPNRAIASSLGISDHTVKFHLAAIFGKLGARTRTEAVRRGLRRGLLHI